MSLVFENELYDMTSTAKEVLLSDELPFLYAGDVIFEEFPYFGNRTDLVTVAFNPGDIARRLETFGHLEPLPDARRYRHSYKRLQNIEPVSRQYWIHEDKTYHTEQTCREVWDWMLEHGYLKPAEEAELGNANVGQLTLTGDVKPVHGQATDHTPCITVKYPITITANAWELKPRDWEKALRQAVRADCYVDYRWVLMDRGGIEIDDSITKRFNDAGVGLATVGEDELNIIVYPDRVQPPRSRPRFMLNEKALAELPDDVREEAEEYLEGDDE